MEENKKNNEIDVIALVIKLMKEWKTLVRFIVAFTAIGLVVAFNTPKIYTAKVILAPEMSSGGLGLASNLADMASSFGIDLGGKSSMDAIYPEIYPDIFSSTDFLQSLFDVKVRLKDDNAERTYIDHLKNDTKYPFWSYPKKWLSEKMKPKDNAPSGMKGGVDPFRISLQEMEICQDMAKTLICHVDKKTSEITISVDDQDPMVAAIMADTLQRRLQAYITDYRTKKARTDYEYYDKLMKEAELKYKEKQSKYVGFSDSHRNSVLQSVNVHEQSLQSKMSSAYEVYATMSKMRDQAKAKIQERTPAFTMIQSAKMPYKASSRSRLATLLIFILLGCIADAAWITFIRKYFRKTKKE